MKEQRQGKQVQVVAVSGGVDSMVLLAMLAARKDEQLVVAHFDHGIRANSHEDAQFVQLAAERYGLPFVVRREELGAAASEEQARQRRYAFLKQVAHEYGGRVATAHHADDVVETVAINLIRGTGWRGVAALGDVSIDRPLLGLRKRDLIEYAQRHQLQWREDATNQQDVYLRNRVRRQLTGLSEEAYWSVWRQWSRQRLLREAIDRELHEIHGTQVEISRYFVAHLPYATALEYLRHAIWQASAQRPTRPQAERALLAVKVARPGTAHDVMAGVKLRFSRRNCTIELT